MAAIEQEGLTIAILDKANVDSIRLKQQLEMFTKRQPRIGSAQLYLGPSLDRMLDRADDCRVSWDDNFISIVNSTSTNPSGYKRNKASSCDL